jgi:two-component system, LytTR family, response regulator
MISAIIIDDEHEGRLAINAALQKHCPDVEVRKICIDAYEGLEAIRNIRPDLIFLDIQMPGKSGFDLLMDAGSITFETIFVSAYDAYAIKAIKFSALDYLLKPLDTDDLILAVKKAVNRIREKEGTHRLMSVLNNIHFPNGRIEKIAVPSYRGIDFFQVADIIYCSSEGEYTRLFLKNKQTELVSRNLKGFEDLLSPSGFCRVHHSYLINMRHTLKYIKGEGGYVILTDDHQIPISRRKKEEFLNLLNKV